MSPDECELAMAAMRSAWQYTPMPDVQARQFKRLLLGYPVEVVRDVIGDLISVGATRPGPAEMGGLLRSKMGKSAAGGRVRRYGPYLNEIPAEDITPPEEVSDRMAELRERLVTHE